VKRRKPLSNCCIGQGKISIQREKSTLEANMYVITGSTGNTGHAVAFHLLAEGKRVREIGRSAERLQRLVQMGGEPFVADLTDTEALTRAFQGAEGVYVMIPPELTAPNMLEYQHTITESIAAALERSGVKHAVSLSSIGADKPEGTGPVLGLHRMEERLNRIAGLNIIHFRCGYFMENLLPQAESIEKTGKLFGTLQPELRLPMIATRDIGDAAAQALARPTFTSHQSRELLGYGDVTMNMAASIIGQAIDKPDLQYVQVSNDQLRSSMLQMGTSEDFANRIVEMCEALNSGHMRALETRDEHNTTPTYFEKFVHQDFLPRYKGKVGAAA
jgi:uncharacterized protein YbjT (DUF2867 family)